MIKLNYENSSIKENVILKYIDNVAKIHEDLNSRASNEKDFVGWLELPTKYDKEEFSRIKKAANKIQNDSDVLVVIGIGGSYLGARAVIDSLTHSFYNSMPDSKRKTPQIVYVGCNLSPVYMNDILEFVADKDISINVISKSGTTTEPAIAFRIFREVLETKYGVEEARKRIYVTTDKQKGALKTLSNEEKYETFVIPDNVGGRYSVLTAVGLLPIATAGINIDKLKKKNPRAIGIQDLCYEIQQMCINNHNKKYNISFAFLVRSLLEQSAMYFLVNKKPTKIRTVKKPIGNIQKSVDYVFEAYKPYIIAGLKNKALVNKYKDLKVLPKKAEKILTVLNERERKE